jgi:ABC-type glycerol-3-phosphate transport system permease component
MQQHINRAIVYIVLAAGAVVMLFPLFWMLTTAFKPENEIFASPMRWLPSELRVENFIIPFQEKPFVRWFFNSIVVATVVTAGNLLIASLAGFGFAKFRFPGRTILFLAVLATFMIPLQVTMIPLFLVVKNLQWIDSYPGLIVPVMVDAFGIFLMRQFISDIPDDYLDQARIDGASELRIWWSIILPMSIPILSALGILTFLTNMDELLWPLIIVTSEEMRTIPLGLATFENVYQTIYNQLMAMALLAMLPVYIVFLIFQRRIIQGISMTGLKG